MARFDSANEQRAPHLTSLLQEQLLAIELANHGFIRARRLGNARPWQGAAQAQIAATDYVKPGPKPCTRACNISITWGWRLADPTAPLR